MNSNSPTESIKATWLRSAPAEGWRHDIALAALNEFERSGFPTRKQENWKYTDVQAVANAYPDWLNNKPLTSAEPAGRSIDIADAVQVCVVDGVFRPELSNVGTLPDGVVLSPLSDLNSKHADLLKSRFGTLAHASDSAFIALNTAFAADSLVLLLDMDTELTRPIYIHYQTSRAEVSVQPRLLVNMGERSKATVIEHFVSDHAAIINPVSELFCGAGSQLAYSRLQEDHPDAWHTGAQYARLEQDSTLRSMHVDTGSNMTRNDYKLRLVGSGAHAEANGLFMANGNRHVDSRIEIEHIAPHTTSRERFRGILGDTARGVFNGRIHVHESAQKTAAELSNRNLLLSKGAEINTKPELEIYADDVKCAHGSTTGQLDETSMFYLLTRGIDPALARHMLIKAFAAELLVDIVEPAIAERVNQNMEKLQAAISGN